MVLPISLPIKFYIYFYSYKSIILFFCKLHISSIMIIQYDTLCVKKSSVKEHRLMLILADQHLITHFGSIRPDSKLL